VSPDSPGSLVLRARLSLKSFAGLYLLLAALGAVIWWAGWTYETGVHPALIVGAGLLPLALGIVYSWLVRLGAEYRLHQESLEVERGIVARSIDNLQLFRVRDLRLRQSVLGRLFGVGDIVVTSTDQSTPQLTIRGVDEPRALYDTLREGVARSQATRRTMIVEDDRPS
jgi:uncharacterized membrane protein YdbT with pleckstrin-like domain